jgi:hypothetical protein
MDISGYTHTITVNLDGDTVRDAVTDCIRRLSELSPVLPDVTAADAGKHLVINNRLKWEVQRR